MLIRGYFSVFTKADIKFGPRSQQDVTVSWRFIQAGDNVDSPSTEKSVVAVKTDSSASLAQK